MEGTAHPLIDHLGLRRELTIVDGEINVCCGCCISRSMARITRNFLVSNGIIPHNEFGGIIVPCTQVGILGDTPDVG